MSVYLKYWGLINGQVTHVCLECGTLVPDTYSDDHADFHVDIEGVDDTLGVGTPDLEDRVRRINEADAQRDAHTHDWYLVSWSMRGIDSRDDGVFEARIQCRSCPTHHDVGVSDGELARLLVEFRSRVKGSV